MGNIFLVTEPPRGRYAISVSDRRTRLDSAACVRDPVDVHYPDAERIVLVLDRPITQFPASLNAAFLLAEGKRRTEKSEIHHTPKYGS